MNARCWETFKGKLYFGTGAGKVMQADTGGADGDASISGLVRSAYNYLQSPYDKQFRLAAGRTSRAARLVLRCKWGQAWTSTVAFRCSVPARSRRQERRGIQPPGIRSSGGPAWLASGTGAESTSRASAISIHISSFTRTDQVSYFSADVVYDQVVGAISETG